jgi:hypothetical protein
MPEIWKNRLSAPIFPILPPARRIGFEKRIVWEILLGQRGSKNLVGTDMAMDAA